MPNSVGFFLLGLMALIVAGAVLEQRNPEGFSRVESDFFDLFSPTDVPSVAPIPDSSSAPTTVGPSSMVEKPAAQAAPVVAAPVAVHAPGVMTTAAPAAVAPAAPITPWAAPSPLPAQPNWTWTTTDGHTYKNVTIQKVDPAKVSIFDDEGGATVAIATLPADLQKKLNYNPALAEASAAVTAGNGFDYYTMDKADKASVVAEAEGLPLAWVFGYQEDLAPDPGQSPQSTNGLTQMALSTLQGKAVVVFATDLNSKFLPAKVHEQLFHLDDGPIPGGHHFISPKIVFLSGDGTKVLGRVWFTKMKAEGAGAIGAALGSLGTVPP